MNEFIAKVVLKILGKHFDQQFAKELEAIKHNYEVELQKLSIKSAVALKELDQFSSISTETYQEFFKKRMEVYKGLLSINNKFFEQTHEDFKVDETEAWGDVYCDGYHALKKHITENQFYISNELSAQFDKLRKKAARYLISEERAKDLALSSHRSETEVKRAAADQRNILRENTYGIMNKVWEQVDIDVAKIRSRIDLDS